MWNTIKERVSRLYDKIKAGCQSPGTSLKSKFNSFCRTLRAGYYSPEKEQKNEDQTSLPRQPLFAWIAAGTGLTFDIAMGLAQAVAAPIVAAAGVAIAAFSIASIARTYIKCKKLAAQQVSEVNAADQTVSGTREDIYVLHKAQRKIIGISYDFFKAASSERVERDIQKVIDDTAEVRARVKVDKTSRRSNWSKEYHFVRPVLHFMDAMQACPLDYNECDTIPCPVPANDASAAAKVIILPPVPGGAALGASL